MNEQRQRAQQQVHERAAGVLAKYLARTPSEFRVELLLGFLHAAASGLTIVEGPIGASEHAYMLADHLATRVAA